MTTTITQPKIQRLEGIEDLQLLMQGDFVNIKVKNYNGTARYMGLIEKDVLVFRIELEELKHEYYGSKLEGLNVHDNQIIME